MMKNSIHIFQNGSFDKPLDMTLDSPQTLVLVFASAPKEKVETVVENLKEIYAQAVIVGASTSGEIYHDSVYEESIVVSVSRFEQTRLKLQDGDEYCGITPQNSFEKGVKIAQALKNDRLKGIFILADGLHTNGSKLTQGIASVIGSEAVVSGGLAGDMDRFEETWVIKNAQIVSKEVCAVGFYGEAIRFVAASKGGWDRLGLTRVVTKSVDNVVYEFDGKPALEIYKRYLGEKAKELPGSALLFPLELLENGNSDETKVRTIVGIDEASQSMTFAGDIPEGSHVTFMKANFERLIEGAGESASLLDLSSYGEGKGDLLCIAISCVGRKLVLKSRIDEEIEAIEDVLPDNANVVGFYSYGEISPLASGTCDLHNQMMTLTAIWEDDA